MERSNASKILAEARAKDQAQSDLVPPELRLEIAFLMSMDALELHRAGLRERGFSEDEIRERLRSRAR
jgi:hypothetical protein